VIINHNIAALNTLNRLNAASNAQSKSMERLSSGLRINRAGDDAAGLAISEKMRAQIRGLDQATRNAQDGISLIQTAEGALNETHSILQRMRELSVQASNDTTTDSDRTELQKEIAQLKEEIDRISNTTEFNTKKLLNGDLSAAQVAQGDILESAKLGVVNGIVVNPTENAITINAGDKLVVTNAATSSDVTVNLTAGTYTATELATQLSADFAAAGLDDLDVTLSAGKLSFTDADSASDMFGFTVKANSGVASKLGITSDVVVANAGTSAASAAVTLDSYDVSGQNQFKIAVNGGPAVAITLTDGGANKGYATIDALITEINAQLDNAGIKVTASKTDDGSSIKFTADNAGDTFTISAGTNDATAVGKILDGAATSSSKLLTALQNEDGDGLGIKSGDTITINGKINGGAIKQATLTVDDDTTVENLMTAIESAFGLSSGSVTLNSDNQIVIKGANGESNDLQDIKLAINGNTKFNDHFSNFAEIQDAQDAKTNNALSFHIGANQDQIMKVDINEMSVGSLSLSSVDISTQQGAENSITVIDNAIKKVSAERSKLGAFQNRLEHSINNLGTSSENLTAAESRIRDVDMAKEMMEQTKNSILAQAAQAMLAQANQQPQGVLQLLR